MDAWTWIRDCGPYRLLILRAALGGAAPQRKGRRMGVQVLVAEDEALIALSLADLLEAEGHEVVVAPDGADALEAARRLGDALDVLVTDLRMPRMGGEDLIRA